MDDYINVYINNGKYLMWRIGRKEKCHVLKVVKNF